jgi:hypothetical protein
MKPSEKNTTGKPREVPEDIRKKQNSEYTEAELREALDRATRRLDDPSAPGRESAKT